MWENGTISSLSGIPLRYFTKKTVPKGYWYVNLMRDGVAFQNSVHRIVYNAFKGDLEDGLVVDHIDNNPKNNHIDNLQAITSRDNSRKDGNKINLNQAIEIKARRMAGESGRMLSREYNLSEQAVCDIYKDRRWRH